MKFSISSVVTRCKSESSKEVTGIERNRLTKPARNPKNILKS